jgi:hypothetical protein
MQVAPAVDQANGRLDADGIKIRREAALDQRIEIEVVRMGHGRRQKAKGVNVEWLMTDSVRALQAGQAGLVNLIHAARFYPDSPRRHRRAV